MKRNSQARAAAALLTALTLSGCGATLGSRGGADLGRVAAGVTLERQPDACREAVPHIAIREGAELRSLLKRERAQLDLANGRLRDCWEFNERLRAGLAGDGGMR